MVSAKPWKLGTGASYSAISGFSWPSDGSGNGNANPQLLDRQTVKITVQRPIPYSDNPFQIDQGTQQVSIAVEGVLWSETDLQNAANQAALSNTDTTGRVTPLIQRLYFKGDSGNPNHYLIDYVYVRNGSFKENLFATNPLGFPYTLNFVGVDAFVYSDSPGTFASANGSSPRSVGSIANAGAAYCFPQFTILNAAGGSAITAITITYGSLSLAWSGSLAAAATLTVKQDFDETTGNYGLKAYVAGAVSGTLSGSRMIIAGAATAQTISCAFTGGSNGAIFTVIVPTRRWG